MRPKILITNLVYGEPYTSTFLNLHLKSLLENCLPPPFSAESIYLIFTDGKNIETIRAHDNYKQLCNYFKVTFARIEKELSYDARYANQTIQFQYSVKIAIEQSALMHHAAADLYYGKAFWAAAIETFFQRNVQGLFGCPFRTTLDTVANSLMSSSPSNDDLFEFGYRNLHPLWAFANWDSPYFTNYPYQMIWSSPDQIICRGFSISVILFKATPKLTAAGGCSDITVISNCETYHVEQDWQNLPILEMGMLKAFYPPFSLGCAAIERVVNWGKQRMIPANYSNLQHYFIIKKKATPVNEKLIQRSSEVCSDIVNRLVNPA
jgi:hypothetical protein